MNTIHNTKLSERPKSKGVLSFMGQPKRLIEYLQGVSDIISYESVHNMPIQITHQMIARMTPNQVISRAQTISRRWGTA